MCFLPSNRYILLSLSVVLILLFTTGTSSAQSYDQEVSVYTEADGLSSSIVRCVLQDSRGMLWIGTPDGLNYYDGHAFKIFRKSSTESNTIKENFITKLTEDQVGDIWIGYLQGGVSCYNISTGVFRHYPLKQYSDNDHIKMPEVTMLLASKKNEIWIGTEQNGIYKLDKHTGSNQQFDLVNEKGISLAVGAKAYNTAYAAYEDDAGKIWVAAAAGLYALHPATGHLSLHRNTPLKAGEQNNEHFMCIAKRGGIFWLGSWSGGLSSYDPAIDRWNSFRYAAPSASTNIIVDVQAGPGDSIQFISNDKGLGYFDVRSERFQFCRKNTSIQSGDYKSIYKDRSNNTWITSSKGLIKMRNNETRFALYPLPVTAITDVNLYHARVAFESDKFLIVGTAYSNGLLIKNKSTGQKQSVSFETLPSENKYLVVTDLFQDVKGTIWLLTRDYLYYLDVKSMQLKKRRQPSLPADGRSNYLYRIQEGNNGELWISSLRNGLFIYDVSKDAFVRHFSSGGSKVDHIPTNHLRALHRDKNGDIWIGGQAGFLGSISQNNGQIISYSTYYPKENININRINAIVEGGPDSIWVGTDAGLILYKKQHNKLILQKNYTSEHGIISDMVRSIARAGDGSIWCLTETSLCRLDPNNGLIANYGFSDGLKNPGVGERVQTLGNGNLFLGTNGGYYLFDPIAVSKRQEPSPVLITSFAVNGQPRYYTSELATKGNITLSAAENRMSFEFTSINFSGFARQQYAYILEGIDTGWTNTYNRYVSYANLQPGDYTFKLRAVGGISQQDSETIIIPVRVSGHFYKSAWFRILMGILLLSAVYLVYTVRLHNQKRLFQLQSKANLLEKEKAMIMYESLKNQLNPHFLFNSLTSLSSLIRTNQKLAGEFLDGLSNTYRYILNSRDKELAPLAEEIRFCEIYIKLQKTRFRDALQVTFNVKEEHLHLKLPAVTLQNLLENAIKHNILTEEDPLIINIYTNDASQVVITNNLNRKPFVETSNRKGLASLFALYAYFSDKTITVLETEEHFTILLPLI